MNKFTKRSQFKHDAINIKRTCDLVDQSQCIIVENVLYEKLSARKFRFFFSDDDYDYVVDKKLISALNVVFKAMKRA